MEPWTVLESLFIQCLLFMPIDVLQTLTVNSEYTYYVKPNLFLSCSYVGVKQFLVISH